MLHLMMIPRGATDQIGGKFKRTAEPEPAPVSVGSWPKYEAQVAFTSVFFVEIQPPNHRLKLNVSTRDNALERPSPAF